MSGVVHELSGPFVGVGAIAASGGRIFVAFKTPGAQRNMLFEVNTVNWTLAPAGLTPGAYYKDGECSLTFDSAGQLLMLNFCSPSTTTGGEARPVLWHTGIFVGAAMSTSGVDQTARNLIAGLIAKLHAV